MRKFVLYTLSLSLIIAPVALHAETISTTNAPVPSSYQTTNTQSKAEKTQNLKVAEKQYNLVLKTAAKIHADTLKTAARVRADALKKASQNYKNALDLAKKEKSKEAIKIALDTFMLAKNATNRTWMDAKKAAGATLKRAREEAQKTWTETRSRAR